MSGLTPAACAARLSARDVAEVVETTVGLLLEDKHGLQFDELVDQTASDPYRIQQPGDLAVEAFTDVLSKAVAERLTGGERRG